MNNTQIKNQIDNLKKTILYLETMIVEEKKPSNEVVPNFNEVVPNPNEVVPKMLLRNKVVIIKNKVIKPVQSNIWKDALKRVSTIFKNNNIRVMVPELTHFLKTLKMKKPISEYSDSRILKKKLAIDAMKRLSIIFKTNNINYTKNDLKIFLKSLNNEKKPISTYSDNEIIQKKLELDSLSSLLNL